MYKQFFYLIHAQTVYFCLHIGIESCIHMHKPKFVLNSLNTFFRKKISMQFFILFFLSAKAGDR